MSQAENPAFQSQSPARTFDTHHACPRNWQCEPCAASNAIVFLPTLSDNGNPAQAWYPAGDPQVPLQTTFTAFPQNPYPLTPFDLPSQLAAPKAIYYSIGQHGKASRDARYLTQGLPTEVSLLISFGTRAEPLRLSRRYLGYSRHSPPTSSLAFPLSFAQRK